MESFRQIVWQYYEGKGRHDLPWRQPEPDGSYNPYKILVSEIMLQQTQVSRVMPKFNDFVKTFPSFESLAAASLSDVVRKWSGLGYNRRAKFLHQTAQAIVEQCKGCLPKEYRGLVALPGVGPNTAGAILAYAYNEPAVFIETNIRTVFIHHFFADQQRVPDAKIVPLIETSLLHGRIREWYWALMDYGTYVKQTVGNASRTSASYTKQTTFDGSRRQIRGQVLRLLTSKSVTLTQMQKMIVDDRLPDVVDQLLAEGLIDHTGSYYRLHV